MPDNDNFDIRDSAAPTGSERDIERALRPEAKIKIDPKFFSREVAVLDTIDNIALRSARRTLRADSLLRVRSLADTARVSFSFDVVPGEYEVRLKYLVDSLDLNTRGLRSQMWLERSDSSRVQTYTVSLRRLSEGTLSRKIPPIGGCASIC